MEILNIIFNRKRNVYLEGPGGTGKSTILKHIYEHAKAKGISVAMTAATGCAAVNVNGQTLHRWAGILLGKGSPEELVRIIRKNPNNVERWRKTKLLLIDEISMVGGSLLDKLDCVARSIRRVPETFGGMQLVVSGDFLQLQPIKDVFAFKSRVWSELNFHVEHFSYPYRYPDKDFFELLQRAKFGELTDIDIDTLKSRMGKYKDSDIKPTVLHSLNIDVDEANMKELVKLPPPTYKYQATDNVPASIRTDGTIKCLDNMVQQILVFRNGAQVMLIVNTDDEVGLVNGSRGVILGCESDGINVKFKSGTFFIGKHEFALEVETKNGKKSKATRTQIPLILAYSCTFHKVQGATLDCAVINLGKSIFTSGMGYVGLSRIRTLDGLYLSDFDPSKIKPNQEALEFVKSLA